jgi:poly(3-hydroxyoctanoate) depolymerase
VKRLLTFTLVDGHLLRVSIRGEGRPLLLIMGLGGNIEMWSPLEEALNSHGIQTVAFDASGTGHSPTRLVPQRMPGLARQAAHLLDALGLPHVDLLGVSFGGAVAQEFTLANPHRVRRLVLASTTCGLGGVPGNPIAMSLLATPLRYYSPTFLRLVAGVLYGPSITSQEELLREQIDARRARPPTLWGYSSQLIASLGWTSLPWLSRITAPTLVIAGDRDPIVPPRNARILARAIPSARLELVHGAGHLLLLDQAERCATTIADFLAHDSTASAASTATNGSRGCHGKSPDDQGRRSRD